MPQTFFHDKFKISFALFVSCSGMDVLGGNEMVYVCMIFLTIYKARRCIIYMFYHFTDTTTSTLTRLSAYISFHERYTLKLFWLGRMPL